MQPWCAPTTYLTEHLALHANTGADTPPSLHIRALPAIIKDDSSTSHHLAHPSFIPGPVMPGSVTHDHLLKFYSPIPNRAPRLVLLLPMRLNLHPPGFCLPLPRRKCFDWYIAPTPHFHGSNHVIGPTACITKLIGPRRSYIGR